MNVMGFLQNMAQQSQARQMMQQGQMLMQEGQQMMQAGGQMMNGHCDQCQLSPQAQQMQQMGPMMKSYMGSYAMGMMAGLQLNGLIGGMGGNNFFNSLNSFGSQNPFGALGTSSMMGAMMGMNGGVGFLNSLSAPNGFGGAFGGFGGGFGGFGGGINPSVLSGIFGGNNPLAGLFANLSPDQLSTLQADAENLQNAQTQFQTDLGNAINGGTTGSDMPCTPFGPETSYTDVSDGATPC
ncbi:MAG: hypothetical protein ACYCW6_14060 [Candidatus Xenobia bacterium]